MCLSAVICVCLRGATPAERPAILRALAELLRSVWPASRRLNDELFISRDIGAPVIERADRSRKRRRT